MKLYFNRSPINECSSSKPNPPLIFRNNVVNRYFFQIMFFEGLHLSFFIHNFAIRLDYVFNH